ncbi:MULTISPECIES: isocitrate lyase/phosphoenolpyruvate mutase family protein [Bosea]|uniref:isocitrate lyase/PEP mutase family protein n=1 Tax=Bosea TaxID=85413 RepID=UPI0021500B75|nr:MULTISPECIES: isocitrate lyase/phosphoenolpyruvate mutase family protein [Bosea]MCR4524245.1 isocitrate lyase/phosphoenolpyruvate mutase family protein [Bosea sp. 47.2.35]MDR6831187.1 2-methylisocitrate lyase-like PEP mutase family enzyme [Bosea robiniae]MDR6897927.1 2-methylisocitrate lyase-like PEP mutase family enzyme [Bosea sp. BE109]MDR7141314.1 2-methylisocitrate lyase-like PEP mutase family enzyme [Bosea sp. BE168]MDR7177976.1 2-methylisocitrate lyase-like PEP mutase family enzyme [B
MAQSPQVEAFRKLHEAGCFVMPNPWDFGSARWLRGQGFKALATTSAGYAFTQGRADQDVPRDMMLAHIAEIVKAVPDLPINADFENGYADTPDGVAANVKLCVATGVAGLSIEDATGRQDEPLYPFELAVERIKAARKAIDETGSGVVLTARAECFLTGHAEPLKESVRRIEAYAAAGADVLYAPGPKTPADIAAIVAAAGGKPVNTLIYGDFGLSVADIAATGTRRISIGGALARAAWAAFIEATRLIAEEGSFRGFAGNGPSAPLNPFFTKDLAERS